MQRSGSTASKGRRKGVAYTQCRTRNHLWVPFVEAAIVSVSADDCDFFDWIDLPSTDAKDIAIGRLRVKISTLNGTVRRLQMVNRALLVSTLILVAAVCILLFLVVKHKFEE
ncbi:uncharacterized protein G2W53_041477 [Senna tora]|uniref:Uncharacterized protein n=1 Tax=Senna tora TaxID=362788 RepID=A0A834SF54_9FABA|nr:uncharacterized protein G2W53_041477 [Senna tora]